jgi:hypothetical protein
VGEKHAKGTTKEGHPIAMTIQVGRECAKNLASAMRLLKAGNRVVLDLEPGESYIQNKKTGDKMEVDIQDNQFGMDLWIEKDDDNMGSGNMEVDDIDEEKESDFIRLGEAHM